MPVGKEFYLVIKQPGLGVDAEYRARIDQWSVDINSGVCLGLTDWETVAQHYATMRGI